MQLLGRGNKAFAYSHYFSEWGRRILISFIPSSLVSVSEWLGWLGALNKLFVARLRWLFVVGWLQSVGRSASYVLCDSEVRSCRHLYVLYESR